ncbi:hypothetical protein Daus18300_008124 [Diaporthe australafricana]|uniref:Cytochrome P450 n=1 Tax=Diaporthe australafricana TaxID=127596 RepID=A0ABR3WK03_9PEZI
MALKLPDYSPAWLLSLTFLIILIVQKASAYWRLRRFRGPPGTGRIARIAPNILITSSPEVWAHVNRKAGYKRSDWYYQGLRFEHRRDNVFTQTDNAKHEKRRKQMAPGVRLTFALPAPWLIIAQYSGRENHDIEAAVDARVQEFVNLIRSKYLSTEERVVPMECAKKVQYFTLDVITSVGLGRSFGMLVSDRDAHDFIKSSEEGLYAAVAFMALGLSWLSHVLWLGRMFAPSPKDPTGFGKMVGTCFHYVDQRAADPTDERSDMLASFIRHGLVGDELRTEAVEQVLAGSDTTSSAISRIFLHLLANPRVQRKLQQEIDEAAQSGKYPMSTTGIIPLERARQLPYLQAVIREGTRVRPPVVNIFSKDVPAGGDTVTVDGQSVFIPGGTSVGYSAVAMHHDKALYGDDSQSFRPERWFEKDAEKLGAMTKANDLIFGDGKWQCLGKTGGHDRAQQTHI